MLSLSKYLHLQICKSNRIAMFEMSFSWMNSSRPTAIERRREEGEEEEEGHEEGEEEERHEKSEEGMGRKVCCFTTSSR